MKVIDKSNRETLLKLMKLPKNIRKYDVDEQYYFIHEIIEKLKSSIFIDDTFIEHKNYIPSKRQKAIWKKVLRNIKNKDYLNAYFKVMDFIDNYGSKENRNLFESEMNNIKLVLKGMDKKIKESTDLNNACQKIINRLNINFWLESGSVLAINKNESYKGVTLADNELNIELFGNIIKTKNNKTIKQVQEVIIKNKKELYYFSKRQKYRIGKFSDKELIIGTYEDECNGSIGGRKFSVCNRFDHEKLNCFYEQFKEELFNAIENSLSNDIKEAIRYSKLKPDTDSNIYLIDGSMANADKIKSIELEENNIKICGNRSLRLLVIADCHHLKEDEISKISDLEYDVCFLLGDITGKYLDMILEYVPKEKIYGVLGNHDEYGLLESRNIRNIHRQLIEINGVKILGFEGSSRYKTGDYPMFNQEESIKLLKDCDEADILVSHDSPYQLYSKANDLAHCGLKGITEYLIKNNVFLNIHGHHHINTDLQLKNGTNIIGVYRCTIIDIPTLKKHIIF